MSLTDRVPYWVRNQAVALGCVALALSTRLWLNPLLGETTPFLTIFPAVLVAARFGGVWAGVSTSILGLGLSWLLFVQDGDGPWPPEPTIVAAFLLFVPLCVLVILIAVQLRTSERDYRTLFTRMSEAFAVCEVIVDAQGRPTDYRVLKVNDAFMRLTGAPAGQAAGRTARELTPGLEALWIERPCRAALDNRPDHFVEYAGLLDRWLEVFVFPMGRRRFAHFVLDVTARRRAELAEREAAERLRMLFKEMNHRVKNNFQIISSILSLQAGRIEDGPAREALQAAQQRIASVAELHAILYKNERITDLDLGAYLKDLCKGLRRSLLEGERVRLDVRCDSANVPMDQAIALGLLVNELVTNAVKHAYPGEADGTVRVRMSAQPTHLLITVEDDGVGMPATAGSSTGLGSQLAPILAKQAGADLSLREQDGVKAAIRIPLS